jgi:O-antigen ligase
VSRTNPIELWPPHVVDGESWRPAVPLATAGSAVSYWALIAFTLFFLLAPQGFLPILGTLRVALLLGATAIAAHVAHGVLFRRPILKLSTEMIAALGIAVWAAFALPLSYKPEASLAVLAFFIKTLVVFWLIGHVVNTSDRIRTFMWALTIAAVPLGTTAIYHFVAGQYMPKTAFTLKRITGYDAPLTANPNDLALLLCIFLPLTIGLLRVHGRRIAQWLLSTVIVIMVMGVVCTFSRGGFMTLLAIALAHVRLLQGSRSRWILATLVVLVLAIAVFSPNYFDRLSTILDAESDTTGSSQERWADNVLAVGYVFGHPIIGAGIGMSAVALSELRRATFQAVHNVYLEFAMDLGVPGLLLFLWLQYACFRSTRFVRKHAASEPGLHDLSCFAEAVTVSMIAFTVGGFFLPVAYRLYFFYMGGLAMAVRAAFEVERASGGRA